MSRPTRALFLILGLALVCGFLFLIGILTPGIMRMFFSPPFSTPDFAATLQVLIPTLTPSPASSMPAIVPAPSQPIGLIVFTCQIYKDQSSEEICIMNADGSDYRRLTTETDIRHFYPSISPDGRSVVYSAFNKQSKHYEIYEMILSTGAEKALTYAIGDVNAPEISPDGKTIVFTRFINDPDKPNTWLMDRDGSNLRQVSTVAAWDPTWSPDGTQILFASYKDDLSQLFIINLDGTGLHQISDLPDLRGRSDWSQFGQIVTYSGKPWFRELFIMNADGTDQRQLSPNGGNSQGPGFSPDGKWVVFTSYFDKYKDINGCEIYIIRVDGTDLRRLTNNDYCDYQPRWGP